MFQASAACFWQKNAVIVGSHYLDALLKFLYLILAYITEIGAKSMEFDARVYVLQFSQTQSTFVYQCLFTKAAA